MEKKLGTVVDGVSLARALRGELRARVEKLPRPPSLGVLVCATDLATQKFIGVKKRVAVELGVEVVEYRPEPPYKMEDFLSTLIEIQEKHDGAIVQFPIPSKIDISVLLSSLQLEKDVDLISSGAIEAFAEGTTPLLPPVVGGFDVIAKHYAVSLKGKRVVVVGQGRLVGKPAALWARREGGEVVVVDSETEDLREATRSAEVLILGAGSPGLITPEYITEGVVLFDAGTSEAQGKLSGDAHPDCREKSSLFTPVPGGVGPLTISILFKNLLFLAHA
jgi:methylenetetrahydrofolate dehydrogenase (NADP+) / methenyltetrahydrofolate cyclohydrolase